MTEREITGPVSLARSDGRLDPAAVGWSRHPLHDTRLPRRPGRGWGRTKRWEYWGIVSDDLVVGVQLSSLDYAAVHGLYVLDRASAHEWRADVTVPLGRGVTFPDRAGAGTVSVTSRGLHATVDQDAGGARIRATTPEVELDLTVTRPAGHESLAVVVPWSDKRFQYTVKELALPVAGRVVLPGTGYDLADGALAVLDHGRGLWPYRMTWNWGAGSGPGGNSVSLGGRWTDGTGSTENALFVDGVAHKIGAELTWAYDTADPRAPWHVAGEGVDATLVPDHVRVTRTELIVLGNRTYQAFGTWSGTARADDGTVLALDGLRGWAEEAGNRW